MMQSGTTWIVGGLLTIPLCLVILLATCGVLELANRFGLRK